MARRPVKLPSNSQSAKVTPADRKAAIQTPVIEHTSPADFLKDRASSTANGGRVYCLQVKMENSNLSGFIFLIHTQKFDPSKIEEMLGEAAKICNETRIPSRRAEMAERKIPVEDPVKLNETWFTGDVDFVEAVMCDKYQFKKLFYSTGLARIVPTVLLNQP